MTNTTTRIYPQHSAFHGVVSSLFSVAILVLAGVFTFAVLANV